MVNHETLRGHFHFPQMSQILARQARAAAACPPPATGGCVTTAAPSPRATDTSRMFNCEQILSIISYSDILILNNSVLILQILVRWGYHTRLAPSVTCEIKHLVDVTINEIFTTVEHFIFPALAGVNVETILPILGNLKRRL